MYGKKKVYFKNITYLYLLILLCDKKIWAMLPTMYSFLIMLRRTVMLVLWKRDPLHAFQYFTFVSYSNADDEN